MVLRSAKSNMHRTVFVAVLDTITTPGRADKRAVGSPGTGGKMSTLAPTYIARRKSSRTRAGPTRPTPAPIAAETAPGGFLDLRVRLHRSASPRCSALPCSLRGGVLKRLRHATAWIVRTRVRPSSHCSAAKHPRGQGESLDCVVARAPRNDGAKISRPASQILNLQRNHNHRETPCSQAPPITQVARSETNYTPPPVMPMRHRRRHRYADGGQCGRVVRRNHMWYAR